MSLNLESIDDSKLVFIRSKETTQLTPNFNSDMRVDLEANIETTDSLQDIHCQLSSCEIPVSFYNFSSNLKNINLKVNGANSLVLTSQHYDIDELCDFITADNTFKFSCEFKPQQNKVILTNTDNTAYTINFGEESSKGLAKALGFKTINVSTGAGGSYISDNSINLNTIHSLFVHTDLSVANVITSTQGNFRNILQKIPVNAEFGNMINYNPYMNSTFSSLINTQTIRSFQLSIKDQNDVLIDFNNANFELSFLFEIHSKNIEQPTMGGRRSDFIDAPIINNPIINPPLINPPIINNPTNNQPNTYANSIIKKEEDEIKKIIGIPIPRTLNPSEFAHTSQNRPKINNTINIPETVYEDKLLNDKQSSELQSKLLELELISDVLDL